MLSLSVVDKKQKVKPIFSSVGTLAMVCPACPRSHDGIHSLKSQVMREGLLTSCTLFETYHSTVLNITNLNVVL